MPVISVITSQAFANNLGATARQNLAAEWIQIVSQIVDEPVSYMVVFWTPYFDATNPLELELHVQYSHEDSPEEVKRVVNELITALLDSMKKSTDLPKGILVGVWPLPIPITGFNFSFVGRVN